MLKSFSLSLGLAIALGTCSLSVAGGHGKALPSGQCETPSAQAAVPSAQSEGCGDVCGPVKKKCHLFDAFKPKPCTYTYEWVLKKKKVHTPWFSHKSKGCGDTACDSCGTTPSGQSYGSGQSMGSGQSLGTTQIPAAYSAPQGAMMPAPAAGADAPPAPVGGAAPAAPAVPVTPPTAYNGGPTFLPAGN
jgi:hypothetical protein